MGRLYQNAAQVGLWMNNTMLEKICIATDWTHNMPLGGQCTGATETQLRWRVAPEVPEKKMPCRGELIVKTYRIFGLVWEVNVFIITCDLSFYILVTVSYKFCHFGKINTRYNSCPSQLIHVNSWCLSPDAPTDCNTCSFCEGNPLHEPSMWGLATRAAMELKIIKT